MAAVLSLERFRSDLRHQTFLGVHLLQTPVLFFQLLEPGHQRCFHAAVLRVRLLERGAAHNVFTAEIWHGRAGLGLLQDAEGLSVG